MDPTSDDLAFTLQQNIMNASHVKTKNVHEELAAVKEVQARIGEWERRSGNIAAARVESDEKDLQERTRMLPLISSADVPATAAVRPTIHQLSK